MHYLEVHAKARHGDVFLVQGRGLVSWLIRVLTGESITHVAVILRPGNNSLMSGDGLWVAEMREFKGYQLVPARKWVSKALKQGRLWYGVAPEIVRGNGTTVERVAVSSQHQPYSYRTLFRVWLSQLIGRKVPGALVCSTFVQKVWEACGVQFEKTADPGDIWAKCSVAHKVTQ